MALLLPGDENQTYVTQIANSQVYSEAGQLLDVQGNTFTIERGNVVSVNGINSSQADGEVICNEGATLMIRSATLSGENVNNLFLDGILDFENGTVIVTAVGLGANHSYTFPASNQGASGGGTAFNARNATLIGPETNGLWNIHGRATQATRAAQWDFTGATLRGNIVINLFPIDWVGATFAPSGSLTTNAFSNAFRIINAKGNPNTYNRFAPFIDCNIPWVPLEANGYIRIECNNDQFPSIATNGYPEYVFIGDNSLFDTTATAVRLAGHGLPGATGNQDTTNNHIRRMFAWNPVFRDAATLGGTPALVGDVKINWGLSGVQLNTTVGTGSSNNREAIFPADAVSTTGLNGQELTFGASTAYIAHDPAGYWFQTDVQTGASDADETVNGVTFGSTAGGPLDLTVNTARAVTAKSLIFNTDFSRTTEHHVQSARGTFEGETLIDIAKDTIISSITDTYAGTDAVRASTFATNYPSTLDVTTAEDAYRVLKNSWYVTDAANYAWPLSDAFTNTSATLTLGTANSLTSATAYTINPGTTLSGIFNVSSLNVNGQTAVIQNAEVQTLTGVTSTTLGDGNTYGTAGQTRTITFTGLSGTVTAADLLSAGGGYETEGTVSLSSPDAVIVEVTQDDVNKLNIPTIVQGGANVPGLGSITYSFPQQFNEITIEGTLAQIRARGGYFNVIDLNSGDSVLPGGGVLEITNTTTVAQMTVRKITTAGTFRAIYKPATVFGGTGVGIAYQTTIIDYGDLTEDVLVPFTTHSNLIVSGSLAAGVPAGEGGAAVAVYTLTGQIGDNTIVGNGTTATNTFTNADGIASAASGVERVFSITGGVVTDLTRDDGGAAGTYTLNDHPFFPAPAFESITINGGNVPTGTTVRIIFDLGTVARAMRISVNAAGDVLLASESQALCLEAANTEEYVQIHSDYANVWNTDEAFVPGPDSRSVWTNQTGGIEFFSGDPSLTQQRVSNVEGFVSGTAGAAGAQFDQVINIPAVSASLTTVQTAVSTIVGEELMDILENQVALITNQSVMQIATQRGAVKAATYSAGNLTTSTSDNFNNPTDDA